MAELAELVDPRHTAVLTMELQRGVSGDLAAMQALAEELRTSGVIDAVALTCRSARAAGARVVHCRAVVRPDRAGRLNNCRILAASAKGADAIELGTPGADVMPELEPSPDDIDMPRLHGLTPFTGTSLDRVLRNMGVSTVVATGNSVNIGVLGLVLSAVDLGYQVVVPRDAVAGVPSSYAEAVLDNTVSLLATLTTSAQLAEVWAGSPDR
jgi:nicotinamidase-related amidase